MLAYNESYDAAALNVLKDKSILYKQERLSSFEKLGSPTGSDKNPNPSSFSPMKRSSFGDKLKLSANKLMEGKSCSQSSSLKHEDSNKKVFKIHIS